MAKTLISIRIDDDVLAYFRERYAGSGYQSAINSVLRAHVEQERTDAVIEVYSANRITLEDLRRIVREELEQARANGRPTENQEGT
jgi:Arc/MetJ family transcription regulator